MYNIRKYIKTGLFDYPPFLLIYFRSFSINSLFLFKIFPVFRSFLPISPLKMFFQLFGLLFLLFDQSLGQTLAKEPTSPDNPMPSNGSPTEEDLIQTLLKSPGLPPAMPPSLEEEPKVVEQPQSKGKTEEPSKEPKGPPPSTFAAVDSFHASQPGNSGVLPPSAPPTYIQCLHQIGARVCDPEGILNEKESTEIDETLRELEAATRKEKSASECERAGLELMVILVRHSALLDDPMNSVQSKLNNALGNWMRDPVHKCEKPVILMLSADAQMMNRRVWTGRHWDVPVNPSEMVQLFMEQDELTRKEKYGEVILNVIDGLLSRYEKRALQQNA